MLNKDEVRIRIAGLLQEHMGIDAEESLNDVVFTDLHKDFDSLALLELQLLLEKEFKMEFDGVAHDAKMPTNVSEMAEALIREHAAYSERQARKLQTIMQ